MKPKVFRDAYKSLFIAIEIMIIILLLGIVFVAIYFYYPGPHAWGEYTAGVIAFEIMWVGSGVIVYLWGFNSPRILDRAFGRLFIYEDRVVYKCFCRKARKMKIEDIIHVGVEDYRLLNRGFPVIRGDEISFVYLSDKPYPEEYKGKISCLKTKKGFIKMSYTVGLAEALIEVLPKERSYKLQSFYGKMKAQELISKKNK